MLKDSDKFSHNMDDSVTKVKVEYPSALSPLINVLERVWRYPAQIRIVRKTFHRPRLPTSCLAVREDGAVVSLEHVLDNPACAAIVNLALQELDERRREGDA